MRRITQIIEPAGKRISPLRDRGRGAPGVILIASQEGREALHGIRVCNLAASLAIASVGASLDWFP
jgi:hypothetical protein